MRKPTKLGFKMLLTLAVFFSIITACQKDLFNFDKLAANQWDPEFAVGLASGSVGVSDINLTGDSYLVINSDKLASIVYNSTFKTYKASDFIPRLLSTPLVQIVTLTPTQTAGLASPLIPIGTSFVTSSSLTQSVATSGTNARVFIDSVILKTGVIQLDVDNKFSHNIRVDLTVPGVLKNGVPITGTLSLAGNAKGTINIDIANLMTNLTKGGTTTDSLEVKYNVTFTKTASTNASGSIEFISNITNPSFKLAYCDVKNQQISLTNNDSIAINILKSLPSGTLSLNDATVKLFFANSFGIPINVALSEVKGYTPAAGNFFLNVAGINPQNILITAPANINQTASSVFTLNKTNPPSSGTSLNLPDFLSKFPKALTPKFAASTNPTGVARPIYKNFVSDTSQIAINAEITIPFDFKSTDFTLKDTFDFDFGTIDNVKSFILRAAFNNGFPVTLSPKFTFTDIAYNTILTIDGQTNALIKAATIDATGKVTAKTATISDFEFSPTVVPNLSKVKKVIMNAGMTTANNGSQYTKLYSDYLMEVKIGAKAKLKQ